jgi:hypothetical protein
LRDVACRSRERGPALLRPDGEVSREEDGAAVRGPMTDGSRRIEMSRSLCSCRQIRKRRRQKGLGDRTNERSFRSTECGYEWRRCVWKGHRIPFGTCTGPRRATDAEDSVRGSRKRTSSAEGHLLTGFSLARLVLSVFSFENSKGHVEGED